jgi:two-component sensor histidine kinase
VEVRDDGPGYPASDAGGHGLGSRLIEALTEQLRGRATKTSEGGAVFRLVFPLPPR